jgi:Tol biopolymer transport system component
VSLGGDGSGYRSWGDATPDGRRVVYGRQQHLRVMDLASGEERSMATPGPFTGTTVSSDGRMVAYRTGDRERSAIMVVPIEGGEPRSLLTVPASQGLAHFVQWLPDGQRLVARTRGKLVVLRLSGSVEREINLPGSFGPNFVIHPDGRRVAFSDDTQGSYELWTLENFLPGPARR